MSNLADLFNNHVSSKIDEQKLTGSSNFFNNLEEVDQFNKLERKYISNVDYSYPQSFAKFGSAVEYYKNCISYINSDYPYDGSTVQKLSWINSLNDFEYYIFKNEFPRAKNHLFLDTDQSIVISSSIATFEENAQSAFSNKKNKLITINFNDGITFESWFKFHESGGYLISIIENTGNSLASVFQIEKGYNSFTFHGQDSIDIPLNTPNDEWHHYSFCCKPGKIQIFVDGQLKVEKEHTQTVLPTDTYVLGKFGLSNINLTDALGHNVTPFVVGVSSMMSLDDVRLWAGIRPPEKIGRYWFTTIDGNDFEDVNNSNLLFYYKFNEGWDSQYQFICLDYSGRQMDGEIQNFNISRGRESGSAADLSGLVQDAESGDIIFKGMSYSQGVKNYYEKKISSGSVHDENNPHILYNKFPAWILEQEEEKEVRHLKQVIQIVASYFDDLFNKIKEISEYKNIKYGTDKDKIYPFYDKILTSAGFDVTELFSNLDIVEKIASRNDTTLFDEDIQKIKNSIFQNIYNNLSYILKSKGTEKSIKSFLRSYGINDNLIKINLYSDNADYQVADRSREQVVKKKTITLKDGNCIYQARNIQEFNESPNSLNYFTLETAVTFPTDFKSVSVLTSSLVGFYASDGNTFDWTYSYNHYYVTLESDPALGSRFVLNKTDIGGVNIIEQAYSPYYKDLYDGTVWNICLRKKPIKDVLYGVEEVDLPSLGYILELYCVNKNAHFEKSFTVEVSYTPAQYVSGELRCIGYYIGGRNISFNGVNIVPANSKFLYCNFWKDYLNNEIIDSHNKDILNYGTDE